MLRAYNLAPGDVINVGPGTYTLATNIVLTAADDGVTIQGSTQAGNPTIFNRNNTNTGAYVFEFDGATGVTLDNVNVTGGHDGIYFDSSAASTHVTVNKSYVYGNKAWGVYLNTTNDYFTLTGSQVYLNEQGGVDVLSNDATLSDDSIWRNPSDGVSLSGALDTVSGSSIYGNQVGISAQYSGGVAGQILIENNQVFDNIGDGIDADYYVLVSGNQVWGEGQNGIAAYYGGSIASGNTVWGNTGAGITAYDGALVENNTVYANGDYGLYDQGYVTFRATRYTATRRAGCT